MNPLTNVKNINKLNETELTKGTVDKKSWHDLYKGSAWIFIGGLAYGLTEGDIICVFSQYGEVVNINLVRDKKTGKTKGFCFLCYANQKSTILAVDNLNGIKLCARTIRVDHVANYKPPKDNEHDDEITKMLKSEGCAPKCLNVESSTPTEETMQKKHKKHKKEKKKHKKRKRNESDEDFSLSKVKIEKIDEGYFKHEFPENYKRFSIKKELSDNKSSDDSSESDSVHLSRKAKHDSHKIDKTHPNSNRKLDRPDKHRTDKHTSKNSKHRSRKERSSSSESDSHSNKKRNSSCFSDRTDGLSSRKRESKHQKYQNSSSSDEYSERKKMDYRNPNNKGRDARRSDSRHRQHDSSSGSERDFNLKERSRTLEKKKHKKRKRDEPSEEFSLSKVRIEKIDEGYFKHEFPENYKCFSIKKEIDR